MLTIDDTVSRVVTPLAATMDRLLRLRLVLVLGPSWALLGRPGAILGLSWGLLALSWGVLGGILGN